MNVRLCRGVGTSLYPHRVPAMPTRASRAAPRIGTVPNAITWVPEPVPLLATVPIPTPRWDLA